MTGGANLTRLIYPYVSSDRSDGEIEIRPTAAGVKN